MDDSETAQDNDGRLETGEEPELQDESPDGLSIIQTASILMRCLLI